MTFVIRYYETADEVLEELEFIAARHPGEDPQIILQQYAPLYLCQSRRPDCDYDLCGTDYPLLDRALTFDTHDDAVRFLEASNEIDPGEFYIHYIEE